jgi:ribosomal protein S18 acetylase RimI-like enzyme
MIRPMRPGDIAEVVRIHLESFPGFFLSFLGPRFLRVLYACILGDAEGRAFVAETGSSIHGFVAGVVSQAGFYRRAIRSHAFQFAWAATGAMVRRPSIIPRLVRALGRPAEVSASAADACLMSVAVAPSAEGKGIGRDLVEAFCAELARAGADAVSLTTDAGDNERTNAFYVRLGFTVARELVTPEGRRMNEYCKRLHREVPDA